MIEIGLFLLLLMTSFFAYKLGFHVGAQYVLNGLREYAKKQGVNMSGNNDKF